MKKSKNQNTHHNRPKLDKDKIELSLIIDDDTRTSIQLDLRNTTDEKILQICSSICVQYDLPSKIKKRLFNQITREFSEIKKEKQKDDIKERKCLETVKRLYYDSINHNNKKECEIETLRKENQEILMKKYPFTPRINSKSNMMLDRQYFRIEDRLFYEDKNVKEKKNYQRLMHKINERNTESKSKSPGKYSKKNGNKFSEQNISEKIFLKNDKIRLTVRNEETENNFFTLTDENQPINRLNLNKVNVTNSAHLQTPMFNNPISGIRGSNSNRNSLNTQNFQQDKINTGAQFLIRNFDDNNFNTFSNFNNFYEKTDQPRIIENIQNLNGNINKRGTNFTAPSDQNYLSEKHNLKSNTSINNLNNNFTVSTLNNNEKNSKFISNNYSKLDSPSKTDKKINSMTSNITGNFGAINNINREIRESRENFNINTGNNYLSLNVNTPTNNLSRGNSKLSFKNSSKNINNLNSNVNINNQNTYSEKYEKILNQKNILLGNSQINLTPSQTPTPDNEEIENYNSARDTKDSQVYLNNFKDSPAIRINNANMAIKTMANIRDNFNDRGTILSDLNILNTYQNSNNFTYNIEVVEQESRNDTSLLKMEHFQDCYEKISSNSPFKEKEIKSNSRPRSLTAKYRPNLDIKKNCQILNLVSNVPTIKNKKIGFTAASNINNDKSKNNKSNQLSKSMNYTKWERLHKTNEDVLKRKEEMRDRQLRNECSFKPKLNKETRNIINQIRKPEDKDALLARLSTSKKAIGRSRLSGSKFFNSRETFSYSRSKSKSLSSRNIPFNSVLNNSANFLSNGTSSPKYLLTSTLDTDENKKKSFMSPRRQTEKTIREQKNERSLYFEIYDIKQNRQRASKIFKEKFSENIDKFKLNNLKELFEVVNGSCEKSMEDVPEHIKDRLLMPTCQIIKNRDLEFNFQNFYLIASEILKNFF